MDWKTIPTGARLTRQGQLAPYLGFIVSGRLKVVRRIELADLEQTPAGRRPPEAGLLSCLGHLGRGNYFGELCGLSMRLDGWKLNRPIAAPESFSLMATEPTTVLVLTPDKSKLLEPYFGLQFVLEPNPHGLSNLSHSEMIMSCLDERGRQVTLTIHFWELLV